jgi:hypothetical protein
MNISLSILLKVGPRITMKKPTRRVRGQQAREAVHVAR